MQDYHTIRAWRRAHALAINVRRATRRMPRSGYSDLKTQMTSAAESIPMNVVEGCAASTQKDFARFLGISIKSSSELEYQLELARDHGVLPLRLWRYLQQEAMEVRKMLCGYRSSVLQAEAREGSHKKLRTGSPHRRGEGQIPPTQPSATPFPANQNSADTKTNSPA